MKKSSTLEELQSRVKSGDLILDITDARVKAIQQMQTPLPKKMLWAVAVSVAGTVLLHFVLDPIFIKSLQKQVLNDLVSAEKD